MRGALQSRGDKSRFLYRILEFGGVTQTGNRNLFRNAERGSGVSRFAHSKHPPPTPRVMGQVDGRDGASFFFGFRRGRWAIPRDSSDFGICHFRIFAFWNFRSFGFSHFGILGVSDFRILELSECRIFTFWRSGFRVPGFGGGWDSRIWRFGDFRSFGFSDLGIWGFSDVDVGLFGFSGMLDFQMFECFCFGLDDFAKIGKL